MQGRSWNGTRTRIPAFGTNGEPRHSRVPCPENRSANADHAWSSQRAPIPDLRAENFDFSIRGETVRGLYKCAVIQELTARRENVKTEPSQEQAWRQCRFLRRWFGLGERVSPGASFRVVMAIQENMYNSSDRRVRVEIPPREMTVG